ncbi:hypothetical protein IZY60_13310 [Lutibacter sp. B2]|nr:hypothetical protein [Lutibacter sp. B2]
MSSSYGFEDLDEDYNKVYHERKRDLAHNINNRNILSMHLGGIIIECYLKNLVIKKFRITKTRLKNLWYGEQLYNALNSQNNLRNPELKKDAIINPGHNLVTTIKDHLEELDAVMPSDIVEKLKRIEDPLNKSNETKRISTYIDIRYCAENLFNQDHYNQWFSAFIDVLKWLDDNVSLIQEV